MYRILEKVESDQLDQLAGLATREVRTRMVSPSFYRSDGVEGRPVEGDLHGVVARRTNVHPKELLVGGLPRGGS